MEFLSKSGRSGCGCSSIYIIDYNRIDEYNRLINLFNYLELDYKGSRPHNLFNHRNIIINNLIIHLIGLFQLNAENGARTRTRSRKSLDFRCSQ